ncbi:hypothetical protein PRIC2_000270 [Phytophthora ramorum]
MSESDSTVVPDQLASLISDEVERQLRERGSVLEAMKEQMAKVLAEFEEMAVNVSSKRSWSNSVARTKPFASPKKALFDIHPVVTPLDIVPSSPPKLPKISGGLLKNIHQLKHNASGGALPPGGARSPDGKITFDKILPRVAHIEKRTDGAQMMLSQQRQQMYERALVRYPQCRSNVFAPSMYDHEEVSNLDAGSAPQAPRASLELDFVYGCRSGATTSLSSSHPAAAPNTSTNNSAFYLSTGEIMWFAATLVILYRKEANTQRYFREHTNEVTSIAVHQNQRIVASGQAGRSAFLLVWNANDEPLGKRFACLKGHQVAVRSISFSHDGKLIASLGGDMYNTICIHDWKAQELLRGLTRYFHSMKRYSTSQLYYHMKREVGTVSQDGYLSIWDLRQHVCIRRLYLGSFITASVKAFCMEFHPAGSEIAIGLSSGELLVVDYDSFKVLLRKNIKSNSGSTANLRLSGPAFRAIAQVKYCPNAKFLAVGVKDTFVYIYDIVNGYKKLHICEGHSSAVMQLTWNKDGDILQSNATDGEILHWIVSPVKGETKQITDAFLVRDVQWIKWTCVFGWPTPGIWSEESPNLVDIAAVSTTGPRTANEYDECGNAHTTSNEDLLAVACRSSIHLLKYPAHRGAKRKVYKAHSSAISALGFSFDDAYLVTVGGDDGTLMQWSVVFDTTSSSPAGVKVPGSTEKDKSRTPFAEDDSTGEQWSSSSPAPPPQDGKQRSNQLSPRKNSRQYRERLVYQDDSSREPEPVGESVHRHPSEEEPISDIRSDNSNEDRSSQAGASGPPVERGVSYRGSTDLDEPRPAPVQVRATHDYAAESPDELNLNRGEILRVLSKAGSDWWLGETCDGTKGYFPASFVEDVDLSAPVSGDESVPNEDPPAEGCLRRVTQDGYSFGGSSWPFALMATPPSDTALGATSTTFRDLPLHEDVAHALTAMRFLRPSPIQLHALPVALFGNDVIGQAKSGTGKTAVFGVTAIEHSIRYVEQRGQQTEELMVGHPLALVLAPTREIAVQIESVLRQLAQFRPKLVIRTCIGGLPVAQDQMHLAAGCHIVVGTPGRVKALVDQCSLPCSAIRLLVLDEVDKLMARDFEKDIQYIADALPERRQTLAFSATFTPDQLIAVTQLMRTPQIVRVRGPGDVTTEFISSAEDLSNWKDREQSNAPELWLHHVRQFYSVVKSAPASAMGDDVLNMKAKVVKLAALLSEIVFVQCMVFCNDKFRAEALATALTALGWPAACITGAQAQATRLEVMEDFRASRSRVLVTTDLTARGIDVDNVNFVVNLDLPRDPATYLHRVGRTGRFGGKISFSSCLLH